MMKAQFSSSYEAKRSRIRRLPELYDKMMRATLLKDATETIEVFQDGIDNDTFRLERLKPATITRKESQSMRHPTRPLHGRGPLEKNSYRNLFRIQKLKHGYRLIPRTAKHWSGRIKLDHLFAIHEFGCTIIASNGTVIRIPPRPAFQKASRRMLRRKREQEPAAEVRRAISDVLRTGQHRAVRHYVRNIQRRGARHMRP